MRHRVEAPETKRRALLIYVGALLGFAAVVLVLAGVIGSQHTKRPPPLESPIADEGNGHLPDFASFVNQHHPPSSGPHYAGLLKAGFYSTPVPEGSYVHNLEHGYIVVLFKRGIDNGRLAAQLQDLPDRFPVGKYGGVKLIVAPYDDMPYPVIALAWDRELPLMVADRRALLQFYQEYVDRGPEDAP